MPTDIGVGEVSKSAKLQASRGLILDTRPYAARGRDSDEALVYYDWQVSDLGKRFVDLISDPPELSDK